MSCGCHQQNKSALPQKYVTKKAYKKGKFEKFIKLKPNSKYSCIGCKIIKLL